MKRIIATMILTFIMLLSIFSVLPVGAAASAAVMSTSTHQTSYSPGEKVLVYVVVRNTGDVNLYALNLYVDVCGPDGIYVATSVLLQDGILLLVGEEKTISNYCWTVPSQPKVGYYGITSRLTSSTGSVTYATKTVVSAFAVNKFDFTPPSVSVTYSPSKPTVKDLVTFTITATDDNGLAKVMFSVDGTKVAYWDVSGKSVSKKYTGGPYQEGGHQYGAEVVDIYDNPKAAADSFQVGSVVALRFITDPKLTNVHLKVDETNYYMGSDGTLRVELPKGKHTVELVDTIILNGSDVKRVFNRWSGEAVALTYGGGAFYTTSSVLSQIDISFNTSLTANFDSFYLTPFTTSGLPDGVPVTITVNDVPNSGKTPYKYVSGWLKEGDTLSFSITSSVTSNAVLYELKHWQNSAGEQTANSVIVAKPDTFTAVYTSRPSPDKVAPSVSVTVSPLNPDITRNVTFTVTANDEPGGSGIEGVQLYVDGSLADGWTSTGTHTHTGGPYSLGSHEYYVVATDNAKNEKREPDVGNKSFTVNPLRSLQVLITSNKPWYLINETAKFTVEVKDEEGNLTNPEKILAKFDGGEVQLARLETGTYRYTNASSSTGSHILAVDAWKPGCEEISASITISVRELTQASQGTILISTSSLPSGANLTVSGSISPAQSISVTLTYTRPDGYFVVRETTCDSKGFYRDVYTPEEVGQWSVQASWYFDDTVALTEVVTFKVTEPKATSSIVISLSNSTVTVGSNVTVHGSVSPTHIGPVTVTVTYEKPEGNMTKTVTSKADGSFEDVYIPSSAGLHVVRASWGGDLDYEGAESEGLPLTVAKIPSFLIISPTKPRISLGEDIEFTGCLYPALAAKIKIETSKDDGPWTELSTVISGLNGTFTYSWIPPSAGSYTVRASWDGDAQHEAASSVIKALIPQPTTTPGLPATAQPTEGYMLNVTPGGVGSSVIPGVEPSWASGVFSSFTVTKVNSSITLWVSKLRISEGESIEVSGSLQPPLSGKTVNLTFVKAGNVNVTRTVKTASNGSFTHTYTPDAGGSWTVTANWSGDENHEGAASPIAPFEVKPLGCLVATSTYESELTPEVQFLRGFRERTVYSTFAGTHFMAVFNAWYYSFSPSVAAFISSVPAVKTLMRGVLYPLIGILHIAVVVNTFFSFNHEVGVVVTGLVASSLIGAVYFTPITAASLYGYKRKWKSLPKVNQLKPLVIPWMISLSLIFLGEVTGSPTMMMAATGALIVFTLGIVSGVTALKIVQRLPR